MGPDDSGVSHVNHNVLQMRLIYQVLKMKDHEKKVGVQTVRKGQQMSKLFCPLEIIRFYLTLLSKFSYSLHMS